MANRVYIKNPKELDALEDDLKDLPEKVMSAAYKEFVETTPIREGNARRNTKLKNKTTILADYAYAGKLDEGYSRQAPNGMTDPVSDFIEKEIARQVGRM